MNEELFEQAYRNAIYSCKSAWKPILWAFLPLLRSHVELLTIEKQSIMDNGCLDLLD